MERRDPNRQKTTSIRKPPTGTYPAAGKPAAPGQQRATGRITRTGTRPAGAGTRLLTTKKPPSFFGRLVKTLLLLIVFLGIPGIIAASFFYKTKRGTTVADEVIRMAKEKLGMIEPPKKLEGPKDLPHPNLVALDSYVGAVNVQARAIDLIQKKIQNQGEDPWDKAQAQALIAQVQGIQTKLTELQENLSKGLEWLDSYYNTKGEAEKVFEELAKDEKKREALNCLISGVHLGPHLEEAAKSADVQKYLELHKKLELDKYKEAVANKEAYDTTSREAIKLRGTTRGILAKLNEALEPGKPATPKPKPAPAPAAFDARVLHPWVNAKPEAWVRVKITAGGAVTYHDMIVKSVTAETVVFADKLFAAGTASDRPEQEERFAPVEAGVVAEMEPVKVGDAEVSCRVIQLGPVKRWVAREGRAANRLTLKAEQGGKETVAGLLGEEPLKLKDQDELCLVYEFGGIKTWLLEKVPGLKVRMESPQLTWEVVDWGTEIASRPEFPKAEAPKPVEPAPGVKVDLPRRLHPLAAFKAGAWARRKTTFKSPTATSETSADVSVVKVGETSVTQKLETLGLEGNVKATESEVPLVAPADRAVGEDKITIAGTEYACVIVETTNEMGIFKHWISKDGRVGALGIPLKIEATATLKVVTEMAEEKLPVAGREVKCLKVTSEGKASDNPVKETIWYSEEILGLEVMREIVTKSDLGEIHVTVRIIDFGDDVAKKSTFGVVREDPSKLELRRVDKLLAEAEKLVIDGSVIVREISGVVKNLPDDVDRLKTLLQKNDDATGIFVKARDTYVMAKERAEDSAAVEQKIAKIDNVLDYLRKVADRIKGKLK